MKFNQTRAATALATAVTKHAPALPVDKNFRIQLQGSSFEHYMVMVPSLALQLDGLSGVDDGDGTCLEAVLRTATCTR